MHVEDSALYSLNFLHAGAPNYWVVVDPRDAERLERRICASRRLPPPQQLCRQFMRHLSFWVPVEVLTQWDIRYTALQQTAGELVVTAPGAYHRGWNGGWNVAEAINYGDGLSATRARSYRYCTTKCMLKGDKPLVGAWPEGPQLFEAPRLCIWDAPSTDVPLGVQNEPLSLDGLLLNGKKHLSDNHVSGHPSDH
jgi:hypothetical protein